MSDTAKNIIVDSNADSGDRLIEMMTQRGTTCRGQLIGAARKAGEQLELWKPLALIPNPRTVFQAGAIVPADPGTVLIILADAKRTLTMRLLPPPPPGISRREMINEAADIAHQHYAQDDGKSLGKGEIVYLIRYAVDTWGGQPGAKTGGMPEDASMNLLGLLFAAMSADSRQSLLDLIETVIDRGFCPAMVGLVGKGSEHGLCGIWPLVLPLARYIDAAEKALGTSP
jgi:hypothetical protein